MPKTKFGPECTICGHPARHVIEAKIIAGVPYREIAPDYGFSEMAITRHINKGHMKAAVKAAEKEQKKKAAEAGLNILKCVKEIYKIAIGTAKEARKARAYGAVGPCLAPAIRVLEVIRPTEPESVDILPIAEDEIDAQLEECLALISEAERAQYC